LYGLVRFFKIIWLSLERLAAVPCGSVRLGMDSFKFIIQGWKGTDGQGYVGSGALRYGFSI